MINIIGAGPSGSTCAYHLAKLGYDVNLFEEHSEIGNPEACTGLFSYKLEDYLEVPKRLILNKIGLAKIVAPNGQTIEIPLKKPDIVLCRKDLDRYLAERAKKAGAKIHTNSRLIEFNEKKITIRNTKTSQTLEFKSENLIGADGPRSIISKKSGIWNKYNEKILFGVQAVAKKKMKQEIIFYPHIGEYAWEVPIGKGQAKIGVAAKKNAKKIFDKEFGNLKITEMQGGTIPLFHPKIRVQKENIYLIGDAARQIKNTTGGGIIAGIRCGKLLAECIDQGKDYSKKYSKTIKKELIIHYYANKIFQNFTDSDWNRLVKYCNNKKVKKILSVSSRDDMKSWITRLIIAEPKILTFIPKGMKNFLSK